MEKPNPRSCLSRLISLFLLALFGVSLATLLLLICMSNWYLGLDELYVITSLFLLGSGLGYISWQIGWSWLPKKWARWILILSLFASIFLIGYLCFERADFGTLVSINELGLPQLNPGPPLFVLSLLFISHAVILIYVRKNDTHEIRKRALFTFFAIAFVGAAIVAIFDVIIDHRLIVDPPRIYIFNDQISAGLFALGIMVCLLIWFSGLIVYSIPSTFLSLIPLLLHYIIAAFCIAIEGWGWSASLFPRLWMIYVPAFAYVPLAGYLFPKHRRIVEYFRPQKLPRLPRRSIVGSEA